MSAGDAELIDNKLLPSVLSWVVTRLRVPGPALVPDAEEHLVPRRRLAFPSVECQA